MKLSWPRSIKFNFPQFSFAAVIRQGPWLFQVEFVAAFLCSSHSGGRVPGPFQVEFVALRFSALSSSPPSGGPWGSKTLGGQGLLTFEFFQSAFTQGLSIGIRCVGARPGVQRP